MMPCLGRDCDKKFMTTPDRRLCSRCTINNVGVVDPVHYSLQEE